jgi:hypothetical protein
MSAIEAMRVVAGMRRPGARQARSAESGSGDGATTSP